MEDYIGLYANPMSIFYDPKMCLAISAEVTWVQQAEVASIAAKMASLERFRQAPVMNISLGLNIKFKLRFNALKKPKAVNRFPPAITITKRRSQRQIRPTKRYT